MANFLTSLFGSRNQRLVRQYGRIVKKINALEEGLKALSDEDFREKTAEFRRRYKDGESLDDLLPEAFAAAREAAWRTLSMRPFDVQLIGGMIAAPMLPAIKQTASGVSSERRCFAICRLCGV